MWGGMLFFILKNVCPNRMIEWIDEVRTVTKQSLLREPRPLPFDREILVVRQNLEPNCSPQTLQTFLDTPTLKPFSHACCIGVVNASCTRNCTRN